MTTACRLLAMNNTGIFHEVTALLEVMLYGANIQVQVGLHSLYVIARTKFVWDISGKLSYKVLDLPPLNALVRIHFFFRTHLTIKCFLNVLLFSE